MSKKNKKKQKNCNLWSVTIENTLKHLHVLKKKKNFNLWRVTIENTLTHLHV